MKLVSKLALAAAMTPLIIIGAGEAQAQKRDKKAEAAAAAAPAAPKGPNLKLSKGFRTAAGPVDAAYKASNWQGVLTAADAAEAAATSNDDKYQLNQYRLQAAANLKNPDGQIKAINALIATGLLTPETTSQYQYFLGKLAFDKQDWAASRAAFDAAEASGYKTADLYLTRARLYSNTKQSALSLAEMEKAIAAERAAGKPIPEDWYKFGYSEASRGKLGGDVAKWMTMHIKAYPSAENWRTALVYYRDNGKLPVQAQLDLFRLMRASNSLAGEKDHYEYAELASQGANYGEAEAVLASFLKTNGPTTAITALNNEVKPRLKGDRQSLGAEEAKAGSAANGRLAAKLANSYLGYGDYGKAVTLFETALTKGGVDADEINTRIGIAHALQGQKDAAKAAFAKVGGTRAGVAQYWTTWLDQQTA